MIVFSGLDGAGKSTQIEYLKKHFLKSEKKVQVFWSRGGYTPGMIALKKLMRKFKSGTIPKVSGNSKKRDLAFSNSKVRKIWLILALIDLIFFYSFYIRIKKIFSFIVICDRYIIDTLIDFKLNFPKENIEKWLLWRFLCFTAVKPQKHFVITIPVEESLKRSSQKNEPFPDSKKVLKMRLERYLDFVKENERSIHIDGQNNMNYINKIISENLTR